MTLFADYDEIIERISVNQLWDFPGGVHPPQQKALSNQSNIETLPLDKTFYVPIKQHIGVDGRIIVSEGDSILKGQALTASEAPFSVPVHAPTSGIVKKVTEHVSAHPSGIPELSIIIDADGQDTWIPLKPVADYAKTGKSELIERICDAGISGMGGAGFPTHIKSNNTKPLEFLIINGIECEPYISSDDRLMREHAWQIRQGIDILVHILQPRQVIIAVEDNKPEALETMSIACQQKTNYQVVSVPTKYPAGGEKQLVQVLTSREVPSDGLPIDVGCIMYNVGTCYAIADAIVEGKPLIERVVTLTGKGFKSPKNVWARLGTPIQTLLKHGDYDDSTQSSPRFIMGGPMMGFTVTSLLTPIVKISNCILVPADNELPHPDDERACIRCSACSDACPASLLPQQLFWYSKSKELEKAEEYNLFDCIECGACAYVCPSEIPLVHYYRQAKADIRNQREEKERSDKAKIRFEARKARLQKEKEEREEKHRIAAEARKASLNKDGGAAKDKIAAALARAKAKKEALAKKQTQNDALGAPAPESDKTEVASIDEVSTESASSQTSAKTTNETEQAKPVLKSTANESSDITAEEDAEAKAAAKKKRVAAAVAKAKAKKLAAKQIKKENNES
ncbi:electron transport complex subunit RsxC [Brumicola nitratireducens]|uniref:Ion-translocating oxidoreductase complex subunit C n=1 Tax=Glaciecola nitratireducens (strain JCM 12485 / KCTC 12276 / FR1064) TaxID=1085623 RepID=G4QKP4_GLANF|nr:electron transport complex subunit RsxC [Glaciecola nitratireducens]AEP30347.1 electron transport complex, RnfABCDGE type, C subunit [Glaciecola nitratireducens FR1064]